MGILYMSFFYLLILGVCSTPAPHKFLRCPPKPCQMSVCKTCLCFEFHAIWGGWVAIQ